MSTKTTLFLTQQPAGDHKLIIHAFVEMHESRDIIGFDLRCSTCNCAYSFGMTKHLGEQLVDLIKKGES